MSRTSSAAPITDEAQTPICIAVQCVMSDMNESIYEESQPAHPFKRQMTARIRPSSCLAGSVWNVKEHVRLFQAHGRLSLVPRAFFTGRVDDETVTLHQLLPIKSRLKTHPTWSVVRKPQWVSHSRHPSNHFASSLESKSKFNGRSVNARKSGSSATDHMKLSRPTSECLQLQSSGELRGHTGMKYSDLFKVPYSRGPARWNSIHLCLAKWRTSDTCQGDRCDEMLHRDMPTPNDSNFFPEGHEFSRATGDIHGDSYNFFDLPNPCSKVAVDQTKVDKMTSTTLMEIRNASVSPIVESLRGYDHASGEDQQTIFATSVEVQSDLCLAVQEIIESSRRYAALYCVKEDQMVPWHANSLESMRKIGPILPKFIHCEEENVHLEFHLNQCAPLQTAALQQVTE